MKLSLVIPNYNGEHILARNLPRVLEVLADEDFEMIIVDDSSLDNSWEVLEKFASDNKKIKLLKNEKNMGFSSTVNKGAKQAKGDFILLLNTDVIPKKGFLKQLFADMRDEQVFAVGCMDESIEEGKTVLRGRGLGSWKRGFLVHRSGDVEKKDTLWVSGGSGLFRRSIWETLGGLDEVYNPFYWEDIDLSYRALKAGYRLIFEPESRVIHEHSKGAIKSNYTPRAVKIISYRNQIIFVWKNLTDWALILQHFFWLPYHLFSTAVKGDSAFIIGLAKACSKLPEVLSQRKRSTKVFRLSDKEVVVTHG